MIRQAEAAAEVHEGEANAEAVLQLAHEREHLASRRDVAVDPGDLRSDVAVHARDPDRGQLLRPRVRGAGEAPFEVEAELRLGDARVDLVERVGVDAGVDPERDARLPPRGHGVRRDLLQLVARVDVHDRADLDGLRDLLGSLRGAREQDLVAAVSGPQRREDLAERDDLGGGPFRPEERHERAVRVRLERVVDAQLREAGREGGPKRAELARDRRLVVDVERGPELRGEARDGADGDRLRRAVVAQSLEALVERECGGGHPGPIVPQRTTVIAT